MSGEGYARKEQTQRELRLLDEELQSWLSRRRIQDVQQQYQTQLNTIAALIGDTVRELEQALSVVDVDGDSVYAQCRLFDLRALWVRRVWQFFREKFDQRDDPVAGPVLQAADEVVWSCYRQVFAELKKASGGQLRPAPLPFIESSYSPQAFPSTLLATQFNDSSLSGSFLGDHLNGLALSVVRLSPACVHSPWWLVYLGHEMGHHIQYDAQLVEAFRTQIETIVRTQKGSEVELEDWSNWSEEIFADLVSLHLMGQWALRAMIELERTSPEKMALSRISYPAPYLRLFLMAEAADRLDLPGTTTLAAAALPIEQATTARERTLAKQVAQAVSKPLPELTVSLQQLVAFRKEEFLPGGDVMKWAKAFLPPGAPSITQKLRAARLLSSASFAAWAQTLKVARIEEGTRQREHLAHVAPAVIAQSREAGTRAGQPAPAHQRSLTDLLMHASSEQLEFEG